MTRHLELVEETEENNRLIPSHWHDSLMPQPGFKPGNQSSSERQLAVNSNALNHTAIKAGYIESGHGIVEKGAGANHRHTLTNH